MSHITDVRLNLSDLDALAESVAALDGEFVRDQRQYAWYGRYLADSEDGRRVAKERGVESFGRCDHVIRPKGWRLGDYEIGVVRESNGTYSLLFDAWGSGQKLLAWGGPNLNRVRQEYAVAVTQKRARATLARKGFAFSRENLASGAVRLRLRRR